VDPERTYLDADVEIGPDTVIEPGCRLRSGTRVGAGCRIEPNVVIDASTLGDEVWLKPHCWIEQSSVGDGCIIGPSAHLRPNSRLEEKVRVGNFVEIKNSHLGRGTKADHLSYIGDADVGERVTIACGAITVNYDGRKKSRTVIGDGTFVGLDHHPRCSERCTRRGTPATAQPRGLEAAALRKEGRLTSPAFPADNALTKARTKSRAVPAGWLCQPITG
jgi:bifunctional N-acetylglucosamine-1-phosphate-uridyltransferase/glucosamine-1-phosphate-acetyltransferase GlmU-like protein